MSQSPTPPPPSDNQPDHLQFDTVEPAAVAAIGSTPTWPSCVGCGQPITDLYYATGDRVVCPACHNQYVAAMSGGSSIGRLAKATALGVGAGVIGAAIWYGVRRATGYEIGLIAIFVGFLVGTGVRAGTGNRGGRVYQILAVLLTYCAICATYVPDLVEGLRSERAQSRQASTAPTQPASVSQSSPERRSVLRSAIGYSIVFVFSLAVPFIGGLGPIGLAIIAFSLWEAWKINARRVAALAGPFHITGAPGSVLPGPPPGLR